MLIGLVSLSALLIVVSGQISYLSPSYSFDANLLRIEGGVPVLTATQYDLVVDTNLGLQYVDESIVSNASFSHNIRLSSENDNATYLSVNGVCSSIALGPNVIFPLDTNVWDLYAAGTESPIGTYSFTRDGIIHQVTIVGELPAVFNFTFGTTELIITVFRFYNTTPDFSEFALPGQCSQFTCSSCSDTSPLSHLSSSYSLEGSLIRNEGGAMSLTANYSVAVLTSRRLQYVDEQVQSSSVTSNNIRLSSEDDDATYLSVNGDCSDVAFNPNVIFPLDTNVWDLYAAGIEFPTDTYSFTQDGITYQVTIVNGIPAVFSFTFGTTLITIQVTSFNNTPPDFSTFELPSECSQFTCTSCFSNNPLSNLSPSYSLEATAVQFDDFGQLTVPRFDISVDITRGLQYVDQRTIITLFFTDFICLSSQDDDTTYQSEDGVCSREDLNPYVYFPLDENVWERYAAGVESPPGTYTFVSSGITHTVTLADGLPAEFIFVLGDTRIVMTVTSFDNNTPDFSVFELPSECFFYSCSGCYNSAGELVGSLVLLLLCALFMYLFSTV